MTLTVSNFSPTGNAAIDGLLAGVKWGTTSLTFNFPTSPSVYEAGYAEAQSPAFGPLNASMQGAVRFALSNYAAVSNLKFTELSSGTADMPSAYTAAKPGTEEAGALAWAYFPSTDASGGDSWYNMSSGKDNINGTMGGNDWATVLHELGHAVGLKHPHDVAGSFAVMPSTFDYGDYTVMSYRSYAGGALSEFSNETWGYSQTLMELDIAAVQAMYGANYSYNSGDTVYKFSPTTGEIFVNGASMGTPGANRIYATLWDGGGTDTYDLSAYKTDLKIDLNPGAFSTFSTDQLAKLKADGSLLANGNIANAQLYQGDARSLIENVIGGSGNDRIVGNKANNTVDGGAGTDTFVVAAARADVTITTSGLRTILTSTEGTDTLTNVEKILFSDGQTFDIVPGKADPATSAYPAAAISQVISGSDPTAAQMDVRAKAAQGAYDYYANVLKVARPELGPYESLGVSFSSLAEFQAKYGASAGDDAAFIAKAYQGIFLRAATDGQQKHFADQISYFSGLYKGAGIAADVASMQARGAVVGQMVGFVMTTPEERNAAGQQIDDKAIAYANSLGLAGTSSASISAGLDFIS